jgi:hypothetical protein
MQSFQNFLDGGQVGAIPQGVSCTPLQSTTLPGFTLALLGSVHQSGPIISIHCSLLTPYTQSRVNMDPLSFQSANPFTTFYPPQGTEYDAYAAVRRIATISP